METKKTVPVVDKETRNYFIKRIDELPLKDVSGGNHCTAYRAVQSVLEDLTSTIGCHCYVFVLAETELATKHGGNAIVILREILDQFIMHPDTNRDVAFAAYYAIGIYYARTYEADKLRRLAYDAGYNSYFKYDYPLVYELLTRYFAISGNYYSQFRIARFAKKQYEEFLASLPEAIDYNICFKIGYLDAACFLAEDIYANHDLSFFSTLGGGVSTYDDCLDMTPDGVFTESELEQVSYPIQRGDMDIAERFAEEAIAYNGEYPKYHYYKARVMFFKHLFEQKKITSSVKQQIMDELEVGKDLEARRNGDDLDRRLEMYNRFGTLVEDHYRGISATRKKIKMRNAILRCTKQPDHADPLRPAITCDSDIHEDDQYVFISYRSADFKAVYIDFLELADHGVRFWYDVDTVPGKSWDDSSVITRRIENAACVLVYLSEGAMLSEAVRKELALAKEFHKDIICISLTGESRISDSVRKMMGHNPDAGKLGSDDLAFLFSVFSDRTDTPCRGKDIMSTGHLGRILKRLQNEFPDTIADYEVEVLEKENNMPRHHHPYEDAHYEGRCVWAVADGITRNNKEEYARRPDFSIARVVAEVFVEAISRGVEAGIPECSNVADVKELLRQEFSEANRHVHELLYARDSEDEYVKAMRAKYGSLAYTLEENMDEPPGCVTVVAARYRDKLVFGSAGDCMGFLVRDDQVMIFSQKQTLYAYDVIDCERDRHWLMRDFVNQKDNEHNYGVVNGDENANGCFRVSHIDIRQGDVIYLTTDGLADYLQFARAKELNAKSMEEIFEASQELDALMTGGIGDDKTLIRITIR